MVITSDSDGVVKTWDISTGIHKTSFQTPAKDYKRDVQLINDRLILVWCADEKVCVWDVGGGKILLKVGEVWRNAEDLRISGDGLKIFHLHAPYIQVWSIQTGEAVGGVKIWHSRG